MSGIINSAGSKSGVIGQTSGFIEMVDVWRANQEVLRDDSIYGKSGEQTCERVDTYGQGDGTNAIVGGAIKMSLNTTYGIWSFPLTGIYKASAHLRCFLGSGTSVPNAYCRTTTYTDWNGSSGTANSAIISGGNGNDAWSPVNTSAELIFKVTNTSTHVVQ